MTTTHVVKRRLTPFWVMLFLGLMLLFLYLPLIPPVLNSFSNVQDGDIFKHYAAIGQSSILLEGMRNTAFLGIITAIITPVLALAVAQAIRAWKVPRLILGLVLIPLFVPGISMGVASALFFRLIGLDPSLFTMAIVHTLWALPFATLVLLTVMANFDQVYTEAAYMLGSSPLRAFFDIELPQIYQGLMGASIFSLILSFNETIRTSMVQGGNNTVQTYVWSQYQQVGLNPTLYALMTGLIVLTLILVGLLAYVDRRSRVM